MELSSVNAQVPGMSTLGSKIIAAESRPERVGPRITALRMSLGMSKAEFADALSYDRSTLTKVESGTAGLDIAVAERIALLYDFGLGFIYRGDVSDVPASQRLSVLAHLHGKRRSE